MSEHGVPADGVSSACEPGAQAAATANSPHGARGAGCEDRGRCGAAGAPGLEIAVDAVDAVGANGGADAAAAGAWQRRREPAPAAGDGTDPEGHLTREVLCRFMDGALSPEEMRHTFRHLLRGCPSCRQQARKAWNLTLPGAAVAGSVPPRIDRRAEAAPGATPAPAHQGAARAAAPDCRNPAALELVPANDAQETHGGHDRHDGDAANDSAYDAVLDRVFSRVTLEEAGLEAARRRAGGLFEELMHHPAARQQLLVQNSSRFRDRMLCERFLQASHEEGFRDPARSQQLARVAVSVAERLAQLAQNTEPPPSAELPPGALATTADALAGLRARAWAQLGNALRICSDHAGAAAAFRSAEGLLAANPRLGLLDKARVFDLKASLHRDRRQFAEAAHLLDRVIAIYRRLGQSSLMGQALAQKGNVLLQARDTEGCMTLLRRALELIDPQEDPRWYLIVRHNLIVALLDDGKPREAFALLFHTRPLYLKMGDRMNLLRLRWLEGQVAQGLHRLEQAEAAFREVRDAFVDLGIEYDAALVSLDLAAVYAQQGRTAETRQLAQEMLVFFESCQIHREAMAALLVFCKAAQLEQAGLGLVREVAAFLKQARHTPDLRFTPPG